MANSTITVCKVFSNVNIPAGTSFTFAVPGLSPENYYSFSVSTQTSAFLTIVSGWYNGDFVGPQCVVTNSGAATTFDLMLLTATPACADNSATQAKMLS